MLIQEAFKYKTRPNASQQNWVRQGCGNTRFVWNKLLDIQLKRLEKNIPIESSQDMDKYLPKLKKEYPFLKNTPSQAYQKVTKNLARAFKDAFDKNQPNKKLPRWKKKFKSNESFTFPNQQTYDTLLCYKMDDYGNYLKDENGKPICHLNKNGKPRKIILERHDTVLFTRNKKTDDYNKTPFSYLRLPKLKEEFKVLKHRELKGKIKNVTLSYECDGYYISIQTEREIEDKPHPSTSVAGGDLGVKKLITTSSGEVFNPLNSFKKSQDRLAKLQRNLARKTKNSNNWKRQKKKISKFHRTIARQRRDYLIKIANNLTKNHGYIILENLSISNMSKSAKGTIESPGKNVAQKSGLNRVILDQGWGIFKTIVEQKQERLRGVIEFVPPHHTSQDCPLCNHRSAKNRVSQALFHCQQCGFEHNADFVGSLNIACRGMEKTGLGQNEIREWVIQQVKNVENHTQLVYKTVHGHGDGLVRKQLVCG